MGVIQWLDAQNISWFRLHSFVRLSTRPSLDTVLYACAPNVVPLTLFCPCACPLNEWSFVPGALSVFLRQAIAKGLLVMRLPGTSGHKLYFGDRVKSLYI